MCNNVKVRSVGVTRYSMRYDDYEIALRLRVLSYYAEFGSVL